METLIETSELWLPGAVIMLCLTFVSGFFSASETAFFYLTRDQVRVFRTGRPRERVVAALLGDPDRLLSAVLFWNLVVNLLYFSVSVVISRRLSTSGHSTAAGVTAAMALVAMILLGEVLPKSTAVAFRTKLAPLVSWPLAIAVRLVDPLIPALGRTSRLLRRAFWPQLKRERHLGADDLERAVDASRGNDALIQHERQVLHNILDLSEITVEEVMRPRGMFSFVKTPASLDAVKRVDSTGDYLLLRAGPDEFTGAIPLSRAPGFAASGLEASAEEILHVPWCSHLAYTLQRMRDQFCNVAVVVDEFGGTVGIVTYEDIVDTILRPAASRTRRVLKREPVLEIAPGRFHVEGLTTLRYLGKRFDTSFEPGPDHLRTVAGMMQQELAHLPEVGDECVWQGFRFQVIDATQRGHLRAMVTRAS